MLLVICMAFIFYCFSILPVDSFTKEFWKIYETVRNEGLAQVMYKIMKHNTDVL